MPAETLEELLVWCTNQQQQGFRVRLSTPLRARRCRRRRRRKQGVTCLRVLVEGGQLIAEVPTEEEAPGFNSVWGLRRQGSVFDTLHRGLHRFQGSVYDTLH